jgi:large conductance mechanosensitive channel
MFKEFKEFAMRGNVVDLAVGIIIGAAFGKIVSSFVNDVVMPPLGLLIGNVHFSQLHVVLNGATYETLQAALDDGAPVLKYGAFIQTVFDFVIVAFAIFLAVKVMNKMRRQQEAAPAPATPGPTDEVKLLAEIRDLLKRD